MGMMDRPLYFDRQGQPMSVLQWAAKVEDMSYQRVAEATVGRVLGIDRLGRPGHEYAVGRAQDL